MLPRWLLLCLLAPALAGAGGPQTELGGHTKLRVTGQTYPDDSQYRELLGSSAVDASASLTEKLRYSVAAAAPTSSSASVPTRCRSRACPTTTGGGWT